MVNELIEIVSKILLQFKTKPITQCFMQKGASITKIHQNILIIIFLFLISINSAESKNKFQFQNPLITVKCDISKIEKALNIATSSFPVIDRGPNFIKFTDPSEKNIYGHSEYTFYFSGDENETTVSLTGFWQNDIKINFEGAMLGSSGPITSKQFYETATEGLAALKKCEQSTPNEIRQNQSVQNHQAP